MSVASRQERLNRAVVSRHGHGEAVITPMGTVRGVFELPGQAVALRAMGSRTHGEIDLRHQALPLLHLCSADATGLQESDPVTVRGVVYLVVRLDPDGAGMTRVALMLPGAESGAHAEWRPWR